MKNTILAIAVLGIVGCGSGGGSKPYVTEAVETNTSEPTKVPGGSVVVVEGGGDIIVTDDSVTIECGSGGCGDISIGNETDNSTDTTDNNNTDRHDNNTSN